MTTRLISLLALICLWQLTAHFANPRLLPGPIAVFTTMKSEAASGALFEALGITLARVAAAFVLAMAAGSAIGYAMGRSALFDREKPNTRAISSSFESSARTPSRMVTTVTGNLLSATAPIAAASLSPAQI